MNARLLYADGRKAEDITLDDRVLRYPIFDDGAFAGFTGPMRSMPMASESSER